jgi:hypothetical protein
VGLSDNKEANSGEYMNWMQKEAMMVILRAHEASMKELRPGDVQANLFAYHFDELIHKGYVEKINRGRYRLTPSGQRFANTLSSDSGAVVEEIKTVIMLYGKRDDEYLLFRRSRHPQMNKVGLIPDRMHRDWSLDEALSNALSEKLGSPDIPVTYRKNLLLKITHKKVIVSHLNALVYEVDMTHPTLELPYGSKNGTAFISNLSALSKDDTLEGLSDLIDVIESDRNIMYEVSLAY